MTKHPILRISVSIHVLRGSVVVMNRWLTISRFPLMCKNDIDQSHMFLHSSNSSVPEEGQAGKRRRRPGAHPSRSVPFWFSSESHVGICCGGCGFNGCGFNLCVVGSSDDPLPRQSSQAQAAEDILDKYRNIKRTSPSDGATGGASYDGTGGE